MIDKRFLQYLPKDKKIIARILAIKFAEFHARAKGREEYYGEYRDFFLVLAAFLEKRVEGAAIPRLNGNRVEDINIVVKAFVDLPTIVSEQPSESLEKYRSLFAPHDSKLSCFVIMPYGGENERYLNDLRYELIFRKAAEEAGYAVVREDLDPHTGPIQDSIIDRLLYSDAVIADLTGNNPNVIYELGLRHATGRLTIVVAPEGQNLPFGLMGLKHLSYQNDLASHRITVADIIKYLQLPSNHRGISPINPFSTLNEQRFLDILKSFISSLDFSSLDRFIQDDGPAIRMLSEGQNELRFLSVAASRMRSSRTLWDDLSSMPENKSAHFGERIIFERALEAFGRGAFDQALEDAHAVSQYPGSPLYYAAVMLAAICYLAKGEINQARRISEGSGHKENATHRIRSYVGLYAGIVYLASNRPSEAHSSFDLVRLKLPSDEAKPDYPFVECSHLFDREIIRLVVADRVPIEFWPGEMKIPKGADLEEIEEWKKCTLRPIRELLKRPGVGELRGLARTAARSARILRSTKEALDGLTALQGEAKLQHKINTDRVVRRLWIAEKMLFGFAG